MAKYDVHRLSDGMLVVDCQSDYTRLFDTRLVAPLLPPGNDTMPVARLEPLLSVNGREVILTTHLIAAVTKAELGRPVDSLSAYEYEIGRALDMLINGF